MGTGSWSSGVRLDRLPWLWPPAATSGVKPKPEKEERRKKTISSMRTLKTMISEIPRRVSSLLPRVLIVHQFRARHRHLLKLHHKPEGSSAFNDPLGSLPKRRRPSLCRPFPSQWLLLRRRHLYRRRSLNPWSFPLLFQRPNLLQRLPNPLNAFSAQKLLPFPLRPRPSLPPLSARRRRPFLAILPPLYRSFPLAPLAKSNRKLFPRIKLRLNGNLSWTLAQVQAPPPPSQSTANLRRKRTSSPTLRSPKTTLMT